MLTKHLTQIWQHILREEASTNSVDAVDIHFKEKSVYYYWNVISRQEWKLAADPIDSAREFISKRGEEHQVALLDVIPAPGIRVDAFQVKDFMDSCGKSTRELAMDSTCEYHQGCCDFRRSASPALDPTAHTSVLLCADCGRLC